MHSLIVLAPLRGHPKILTKHDYLRQFLGILIQTIAVPTHVSQRLRRLANDKLVHTAISCGEKLALECYRVSRLGYPNASQWVRPFFICRRSSTPPDRLHPVRLAVARTLSESDRPLTPVSSLVYRWWDF